LAERRLFYFFDGSGPTPLTELGDPSSPIYKRSIKRISTRRE